MKPRFKKVYIEVTNQCNLHCDFCAANQRVSGLMKVDDFRTIVQHIRPYTDYIYLHVLGEPLLHPSLDTLLDIAAEAKLWVNLTTNGLLLESWKERILQKTALRQINISLHSRGGFSTKPDTDGYIDQMLRFTFEAKTMSDVIISLRLWNISAEMNPDHQFNLTVLEKAGHTFGKQGISEILTGGKQGVKLAERVYLNLDTQFAWPALAGNHESTYGFCYGLRDQIAILVDGTVVPCCLDSQGVISLGNILTGEIGDILSGARASALFEGFSRRTAVETLCRHCSYKTRFNA